MADRSLRQLLTELPAVMINGPRATGKTTTAKRLTKTVARLDRPAEAEAFRADPDAALRALDEPLLIDEWQEVPDVLGAVKRAIDDDFRPGRFVLTGSVRARSQGRMWPGTGRIVQLELYGLTQWELHHREGTADPTFLDALRLNRPDQVALPDQRPDLVGYVELALGSGFPEVVFTIHSDAGRQIWLESYLDQLLSRDAALLGHDHDAGKLRRYFEALSLNTAGVAADRTIYQAAGINARTALRYEQLLADLYVLDRVPVWGANRLNRLAKAPKRYLFDPALMDGPTRLSTRTVLADGDLLGRLIDTFVVAQLRSQINLNPGRMRMHHLRSEGGRREIDIVIEGERGMVVALEIKASAAPRRHDARHLRWLRDELGDRFAGGAVLHTGPATFALDERILAVPICALWG